MQVIFAFIKMAVKDSHSISSSGTFKPLKFTTVRSYFGFHISIIIG